MCNVVVLRRSLSNSTSPLVRALRAYRQLDLAAAPPTVEPTRRRPQPGRAIHLNARQIERLVENYEAGATVYELADEFGIGRNTVSARLKAAGISMRRSGHTPTPAEVDEMVRLYESGRSLAKIGKQLGYVPRTVQRHLTHRGVQLRGVHCKDFKKL